MDEYNAIISIGNRCYTEMYLKQMGYKKFSCPFDAIFSNTIDDIIYLFENKIDYDKLIYTENIDDPMIRQLNEKHGLRTIHTQFNNYNENDLSKSYHLAKIYHLAKSYHLAKKHHLAKSYDLAISYHLATFAHHNLNDDAAKEHFNRCFRRLDIIKERKIKTLFCLFNHPRFKEYLSIQDMIKIKQYLCDNYNCHLLVIEFAQYSNNKTEAYKILGQDKTITYIHVNNSSLEYVDHENALQEIFKTVMKINPEKLLTYEDIV